MTCPDIYLGPDIANAPPTPFWANPAIAPSTTSLVEGTTYVIPVTARNNGTDVSPLTKLELYWSDPTTGFMAVASRKIGEANVIVPGAVSFPAPTDGEVTENFGWTPDATPVATNGGHVCLLARLENLSPPADGACTQQFYGSNPTVDPLSAIRNIHVYAPPPPPPAPDDDDDDGAGFKRFMAFAFAATNTLKHTAKTRLSVRHLHPEKDEKQLRWLAADPAVHRSLGKHGLKFAEPRNVLVAEGRERILVPRLVWDNNKQDPRLQKRLAEMSADKYRLSHLGPLPSKYVQHLLAPRTKPMELDKPADVELLPGEMRHTMVLLEPADRDGVAHVVDVEHTGPDGEAIGGLRLIFVPPPNWFERK